MIKLAFGVVLVLVPIALTYQGLFPPYRMPLSSAPGIHKDDDEDENDCPAGKTPNAKRYPGGAGGRGGTGRRG